MNYQQPIKLNSALQAAIIGYYRNGMKWKLISLYSSLEEYYCKQIVLNYLQTKNEKMTKALASYTHEVTNFKGKKCIVIEDLDQGGRTVTNDIENVVEEIADLENIEPMAYLIVYKDSDGIWDGWDPITKSFIGLRQRNSGDALLKLIARMQ